MLVCQLQVLCLRELILCARPRAMARTNEVRSSGELTSSLPPMRLTIVRIDTRGLHIVGRLQTGPLAPAAAHVLRKQIAGP